MGWDKQGNLSPEVLIGKTFRGYTEAVVDYGVVADTCALDITNGTVVKIALSASTLCTITMPNPVAGQSFVLFVKQPTATGGNGSIAFPGVHWPYNATPLVTVTPGKQDMFTFFSDGASWFGSYAQGYDAGDQDVGAGAKFALPNPSSVNYPVLHTLRRVIKARSNSRR